MLTANDKYLLNRMNSVAQNLQLGDLVHKTKNLVKVTYDYAVSGGAVGAVALYDADGKTVTLPDNAIIVGGFIDILTAMVSTGGSGTIALTAESAGDLKAAVDADTLSGIVAIIPVGTAATHIKLTAARTLVGAVATQALTAGKFDLYVEYVLGS
jgi:hypothetical protein